MLVFLAAPLFGRNLFRQKKNKDTRTDFVPILEPMEYTRVAANSFEAYKNHYQMMRAYFSDAQSVIGFFAAGEKRARYHINQIVSHLEGMAALLTGPQKEEANGFLIRLREVLKEYDKPAGIRRHDLIKSAIRKVELDIRRTLKPDMVKESMTR